MRLCDALGTCWRAPRAATCASGPRCRTRCWRGTAGVLCRVPAPRWPCAHPSGRSTRADAVVASFAAHAAPITALVYSRDGHEVYTSAENGDVRLWQGHLGARQLAVRATPAKASGGSASPATAADGCLRKPGALINCASAWFRWPFPLRRAVHRRGRVAWPRRGRRRPWRRQRPGAALERRRRTKQSAHVFAKRRTTLTIWLVCHILCFVVTGVRAICGAFRVGVERRLEPVDWPRAAPCAGLGGPHRVGLVCAARCHRRAGPARRGHGAAAPADGPHGPRAVRGVLGCDCHGLRRPLYAATPAGADAAGFTR